MIKFKEYITEVIHGPSKEFSKKMSEITKKDTIHDSLSKKYILPDEEKQHAKSYTGTAHESINAYLNHGEEVLKDHNLPLKHVKMIIPHLDSATTSHEAPHDFHVYSGIKFDPTEGKDHKEPFKAHIKQFTSASLHPSMTRYFSKPQETGGHILKIHIPAGSKHGSYIGHISRHSDEYEFLLKRNLKLKVHHEPEMHNFGERKFKIWHATVEE